MSAKTLYILRHAEADMPRGTPDRERPLTESGHRDASAVAEKMREDGLRPDIILCSPARRTRETCEKMRAIWPEIAARFPDRLYLASTGDLYEILKQQDSAHHSVMLVGHNPGIQGLVQFLCGEAAPELMMKLMGGYRTGSLSVLETGAERWTDLMPGGCLLNGLFVGKELA